MFIVYIYCMCNVYIYYIDIINMHDIIIVRHNVRQWCTVPTYLRENVCILIRFIIIIYLALEILTLLCALHEYYIYS